MSTKVGEKTTIRLDITAQLFCVVLISLDSSDLHVKRKYVLQRSVVSFPQNSNNFLPLGFFFAVLFGFAHGTSDRGRIHSQEQTEIK